MLKVLIADDHEIVRRGIIQILKEEFTFLEIGEASDTKSLVQKAFTKNWDIIISDISMPEGGGIKAFLQIKEKLPHQKFLFISIYPQEQYALRLLSAGASGFINKDAAPDELITAVKTVLEGRRYISAELAALHPDWKKLPEKMMPHELLSKREFEVFIKLASGISVSEIAKKLSISVNAVSTYRSRILKKMKMNTNADLTRYADENKLTGQ